MCEVSWARQETCGQTRTTGDHLMWGESVDCGLPAAWTDSVLADLPPAVVVGSVIPGIAILTL